MGYKVLVVTEDFTKDEHVIKPVVEKILADVGKPNAAVLVCRDPNFGGVGEALKVERLKKDVIDRYPMVDLFILLVDRDGDGNRGKTAANLEAVLNSQLHSRNVHFIAELAYQEIEVFVLAGHDLPDKWSWQRIRADANVKDTYFKDFVKLMGVDKLPYDGRNRLMAEGIKHWARIKSRCPEDIGRLLERLSRSIK